MILIHLTRAIPERIRGGYEDALYKSMFTLLTSLLNVNNCLRPYDTMFVRVQH